MLRTIPVNLGFRAFMKAIGNIMKQINYAEFISYIAPLAIKIGYLPSVLPNAISHEFMKDLYDCCLNPRHEWEAQSTMFSKWGLLNLDFKYLVSSVINLMRNYEHIFDINEKNIKFVRASCYKPISNCPNEKIFSVQDLLNGFRNPESNSPVIPKIECAKNRFDGGGMCTCFFIEEIEIKPGQDPAFSAWLKNLLRPSQKP